MTNGESFDIDSLAQKAEDAISLAGHGGLPGSDEVLTELQAAVQGSENARRRLGPLIGRLQSTLRSVAESRPNWVSVLEGRLAIGHRPKVKVIRTMSALGATHVLTLLSESEGAEAIGQESQNAGLGWIWLPMKSAKPAAADRREEIVAVFEQLRSVLGSDGGVYVHCSAGIHRTGMFTYAFLRHAGYSSSDAADILVALRLETANGVGDERKAWGEQFA